MSFTVSGACDSSAGSNCAAFPLFIAALALLVGRLVRERGVDLASGFLLHGWDDVTVDVHGHRDLRVTEDAHDDATCPEPGSCVYGAGRETTSERRVTVANGSPRGGGRPPEHGMMRW
jgi:hypothetical protein